MKRFICLFILLILQSILFAQGRSIFSEFVTSHFSRSASMGNTYVGVAENTEAAYINNAGLAFENQYGIIWSNGKGLTYVWGDPKDNNFALSIPVKFLRGTISAYYIHQELGSLGSSTATSQLNVSFSKELFRNFALGLGLTHYHGNIKTSNSIEESEASGNSFGLSLSSLYKIPELNLVTRLDEIRIGAVLTNLTSSTLYYIDEAQKDPIVQELRAGISYSIKPDLIWQDLRLIRFLLAASGNFTLTKYEFDTWTPNWGCELTILETVFLRYGRENWKSLFDSEASTLQFPVSRYGFGVQVPINKILPFNHDIQLSFDMTFSNWDKEELLKNSPYSSSEPIQDSFISFQVLYGIK